MATLKISWLIDWLIDLRNMRQQKILLKLADKIVKASLTNDFSKTMTAQAETCRRSFHTA